MLQFKIDNITDRCALAKCLHNSYKHYLISDEYKALLKCYQCACCNHITNASAVHETCESYLINNETSNHNTANKDNGTCKKDQTAM